MSAALKVLLAGLVAVGAVSATVAASAGPGPAESVTAQAPAGPVMIDVIDGKIFVHAAPDDVHVHADGSVHDHGTVAAAAAAGPARFNCIGDGTSGPRVHLAVVTDDPDRTGDRTAQVVNVAAGVDAVFVESAAKTGGVRKVRWATGADCVPDVVTVDLSGQDLASEYRAAAAARKELDRRGVTGLMLLFLDLAPEARNTPGLCGVAFSSRHDRPGIHNPSYWQTSHAAMWPGCWTVHTTTHELVHLLGAVNSSAPNATAGAHCTDEHDVMCYADGPDVTMRHVCPASQERLLDCNDDDYFHTNPPAGSYLARHWNTAMSPFLWDPARSRTEQAVPGPAARTSVTLARELHADRPIGSVVVVGQDAPADAMVAGFVAGVRHSPIVVAGPDGFDPETLALLAEHRPIQATIVGGVHAVPAVAGRQLRDAGVSSLSRVFGGDRFATANRVLAEADYDHPAYVPGLGRIGIVVSGHAPADAAAAAPFAARPGAPVALAGPDGLSAATLAALDGAGIDHLFLIGGRSVLPARVESQLAGAGFSSERIFGDSREETSVAVAELLSSRFGYSTLAPVVADHAGTAAFVAGPFAARQPTSPLLVRSGPGGPVDAWLERSDALHVFRIGR